MSTGAAPRCPVCGAAAAKRVGQWGGQIITAHWRCEACNSYFEAIREDFDDAAWESAMRIQLQGRRE